MDKLEILSVKDVNVGDIVQYKPLSPNFSTIGNAVNTLLAIVITFVTRSKYNHTSLVKAVDGNNIYITEAHMDTGVVSKLLNPKWYDSVTFMTFSSDVVRNESARWWDNQVGSEYDTLGAFLSGVFSFFRIFRRMQLPFDRKNKFFCSNGVALAFDKHKVAISNVHPSHCCPGDIYRYRKNASRIYKIKE